MNEMFNFDTICAQFSEFTIKSNYDESRRRLRVKHDLQVIYAAHILKQNSFNYSLLSILSTDFRKTMDLYTYLLHEIRQYNIDVMEIMPLIDDYLEYFELLSH